MHIDTNAFYGASVVLCLTRGSPEVQCWTAVGSQLSTIVMLCHFSKSPGHRQPKQSSTEQLQSVSRGTGFAFFAPETLVSTATSLEGQMCLLQPHANLPWHSGHLVASCHQRHTLHHQSWLSKATWQRPQLRRPLLQPLTRMHLIGNQSIVTVVNGMRRHTIEQLIHIANFESIDGVTTQDQLFIQDYLLSHLQTRAQNRSKKGKKGKKLFVPFFTSILLDEMPLQRILSSVESKSLLPPQMRGVHTMLGFRYSRPIGGRWFNYRTFASEHTWEELQHIASEPCKCHTVDARFKLNGCDHVSTCSADFIREYPRLSIQA